MTEPIPEPPAGEENAPPEQKTGPRVEQEPTAEQPTGERVTSVTNNFYREVDARGSVIGASGSEAEPPGKGTGTLRPEAVDAELACFVEPEPYATTLCGLRDNRVVAITGPSGLGKRTSAISLAVNVTNAPLTLLSPVITLKELAGKNRIGYEEGHAYLVIDWQGETRTADTEFQARLVQETVAEAGAYLIITCAEPPRSGDANAFRYVPWERPDVREVIRRHGADAARLDEAAGQAPPEASLTGVVTFARRLAAGEDCDTALAVFDIAARQDVREWFDGDPDPQDVIEATALAFLLGTNERRFETLLAGLETAMRSVLPDDAPAGAGLRQRRATRAGDDGLIRVELTSTETARERIPVFKMQGYRFAVLVELWERYSADFWDAVAAWLGDITDEQDSVWVAESLALFAHVDFDELTGRYLDLWSRTWPGQRIAAYVLWFMCGGDLAPLALRTAARWAGQGSPAQRWTAALAFSGELGLRYPSECVKRLWRLIVQMDDRGADGASAALAGLYATLVEGGRGAGIVLTLLDRQVGDALAGRTNLRLRKRAVGAALAVLSAADRRTGHSSVMIHLVRQPHRVDRIARIWAGVLRHRGFRRQALRSLLDGVYALGRLSDEPADVARTLGLALAAALPEDEQTAFLRDFGAIQSRSPKKKANPELAQALMRALATTIRSGGVHA